MTELSDNCIIRNYHSTDFDALVRLKNEAAALAADGRYLPSQVVRDMLGRPDYTPEQNLFVAEIAGVMVGYVDIVAEVKIGRAVLEGLVLPEYRQQGVARKLYRRAASRAKALGAKVAHVALRENNTLARLVLEKAGFHLVRRSHELTVGLTTIPELTAPTSFPIRSLRAGEEAKLTDIQNRAFTGTWGYNPNTLEEISYAVSMVSDAREGIFLALNEDRPIGYHWTNIEYDEQGGNRGRVSMIGVDPDYRGKGISRELLLTGLGYLRGRGLRVAQLTVFSGNSAATALYRSVGFKKIDTSLWYEKALGESSG